LYRVASRG
jgi:hypothetical protein